KVITINSCRPNPSFIHVQKNASTNTPDHVVWKNNDAVAHTITFGTSPFVGGATSINVGASATTSPFAVDATAAKGAHGYWINCLSTIGWASDSTAAVSFSSVTTDSGPGPSVVVDD